MHNYSIGYQLAISILACYTTASIALENQKNLAIMKIYPVKTFTEKHKDYPDRFPVPNNKRSWDVPFPEYNPPYPLFEHLSDKPWRKPELKDLTHAPKNPYGRTGIEGRGILGEWGPNYAADPIITRYDPTTGKLLVLLIMRGDTGEWAIPGGMVDPGEKLSVTASRELQEETGIAIAMDDARQIYQGFVDDCRNTDRAWMETVVFHKHLDNDLSLKIEKNKLVSHDAHEVKSIQWVPYDDKRLLNLYASHTAFINEALKDLPTRIAPFAQATEIIN